MSLKAAIAASPVQKGDVVWVPYRRDPLWPALVQNVYPKKITFVFFPLPKLEQGKKWTSFSCHRKSAYAMARTDVVPENASLELLAAVSAAQKYLSDKGWLKGSKAPQRPHVDGLVTMDIQTIDAVLAECVASTSSPAPSVSSSSAEKEGRLEKENDTRDSSEVKTDANSSKNQKKHSKSSDKKREVSQRRDDPGYGFGGYADGSREVSEEPIVQVQVPLRDIVFENLELVLSVLWESDLIRSYTTPERATMNISLPSSRFISDDDADRLFEKIVAWVTNREQDCRLLPAIHLSAHFLFPEVIIYSLQKFYSISYEEACERLNGQESVVSNGHGPEPCKAAEPVLQNDSAGAGHGLDELVRVACEERERGVAE